MHATTQLTQDLIIDRDNKNDDEEDSRVTLQLAKRNDLTPVGTVDFPIGAKYSRKRQN